MTKSEFINLIKNKVIESNRLLVAEEYRRDVEPDESLKLEGKIEAYEEIKELLEKHNIK